MKKLAFLGVLLLVSLSFTSVHAATECAKGDNFSARTGLPCTQSACAPGDLYSSKTGLPCSVGLVPGCLSTAGYSVTTGHKCDGSTPLTTLITKIDNLMNTQTNTADSTIAETPLKISGILVSNNNQTLTVKTTVPTTVKLDYIDFNSSLFPYNDPNVAVANNWNTRLPMFLNVVNNPANIMSYGDKTLADEHTIPFSALSVESGHMYAYMITVADENGNSAVQSFPGDTGSGVETYNWNIDNVLIVK